MLLRFVSKKKKNNETETGIFVSISNSSNLSGTFRLWYTNSVTTTNVAGTGVGLKSLEGRKRMEANVNIYK